MNPSVSWQGQSRKIQHGKIKSLPLNRWLPKVVHLSFRDLIPCSITVHNDEIYDLIKKII